MKKKDKKVQLDSLPVAPEVYCRLDKIASENGETIEKTVNNIILSHLDWCENIPRTGGLLIWKSVLEKLLEKYSSKEITDIITETRLDEMVDTLLFIKKEKNINAVVNIIEDWLKFCGYKYNYQMNGLERTYIIEHDWSDKLSILLLEISRNWIEAVGGSVNFSVNRKVATMNIISKVIQ